MDPEVYRRARATAALEGMSMEKAVSKALERWTDEMRGMESEREYLRNLEWVRLKWDELAPHKGKAVVVSSARLQGAFGSYDLACKFAARFGVALTFVVRDRPREREIEIGPDLEIQQGA